MKKRLFLTSCIAVSFVAPAFAETFPTDGYMKENKTYENAATETNMDGVYEGTVNANAEYETINYLLNAGQYLPADSETVITCPAGSYCPGISGNVQYNQSSDQGIQTCPSGYASSATGASSDTQCYRTCDINNMGTSFTNIAHATAISGNDYYGSGTDTCEPTACENGWHVKAAVVAPNLTTLIGVSEAGADYVATDNNGSQIGNYNNMTVSGAGIYGEAHTFVVDYGNKGMIKGHGRCSTRAGANNTWSNGTYNVIQSNFVETLTDETDPENGGGYCYCHLDSYTASGSQTAIALSGPWVFDSSNSVEVCARYCADGCADRLRDDGDDTLAFRAAVFGAIESSPAMCEANVININWNDVDPEYAGQNNEGTAVYGEDVRTPVKAATKKGKTFKGWRFSKPEQTTTGNNG